ncbi:hypothetical protein GCM10027277_44450 [Pseudoduganella ginsengisoli]
MGAALAAETAPEQAMKEMAGVYKHRFRNGIITPGKAPMEADTPYESEDIVEIVPYDATHIYVRAELQFYNGHSCSISGMAGYEQGRFVYHDPEKAYDGGPPCTLAVASSKDGITLTDRLTPDGGATCRSYCGARGSLSDYTIAGSKRRPIRYMDRLQKSREYQKAVDDLQRYEAALPKR